MHLNLTYSVPAPPSLLTITLCAGRTARHPSESSKPRAKELPGVPDARCACVASLHRPSVCAAGECVVSDVCGAQLHPHTDPAFVQLVGVVCDVCVASCKAGNEPLVPP